MISERYRQIRRLAIFAVGITLVITLQRTDQRWPGENIGYQPNQPITYSHRLHAGELEIPCLYCHYAAETSRHAGIPPASVCMNCHKSVSASMDALRLEDAAASAEKREPRSVASEEIAKIYEAMALGADMKYDPEKSLKSIEWVKIHNLPDFVYFNHAPHIAAKVECVVCHGEVATMEQVSQISTLAMGWCLECHQAQPHFASVPERTPDLSDCAICHY